MRASDGKRPCQEARVYYYDLLCPDEAAVPPVVRQHVATCPFCREQMGRLRETLFEEEREPRGSRAPEDETIEALAEQFRLLDERVTCSDARPCLPQLALATPQIRIPTPVTVHVDHCPQCAKDLAALRKLHLTADQLRRLGQLFASQNGEGLLPAPACLGGTARTGSHPVEGAVRACQEVSAADIFDSVVPFGVPPDQRQKAITAHIRVCPICLEGARKLHRTINAIVERADSKIKTVYHAAEDTEDAPAEMQDACQYPVSVEVVHAGAACDPDGLRGISRACMHRLRRSAAPVARMAGVGIVVVVLAALLRTTVPTASGTNVGQVRKAVDKAPNIRVVATNPQTGLVQELLIARGSDRLVHRTTIECALYDLKQDRKQIIGPQTGVGAPTTKLSKFEHDKARRLMANCLFDVLGRIAPDTQLHPSADNTGTETEKGLDVYELRRSQPAGKSLVHDRWRVYIDPATGLPRKTESYHRGPPDLEWRLVRTTVYTYPDEQEMHDSIRALLTAN